MKLSPTSFRASLYFAIAFLAPFSDKVLSTLYTNQWPTMQIVVASCLSGCISGLVALRAYYDGSALRNAQEAETVPIPNPTPEGGQPPIKPVVT